MPYGMMTALLLFIFSSGYWSDGIIPLLVAKVLAIKTTLLLGPPVALGAFVVGQGAGLLLGKVAAIAYIVNRWIKIRRHEASHHHHYAENPLHGWEQPPYYGHHFEPQHPYGWNNLNLEVGPDTSGYGSHPYYGTYGYPQGHPYDAHQSPPSLLGTLQNIYKTVSSYVTPYQQHYPTYGSDTPYDFYENPGSYYSPSSPYYSHGVNEALQNRYPWPYYQYQTPYSYQPTKTFTKPKRVPPQIPMYEPNESDEINNGYDTANVEMFEEPSTANAKVIANYDEIEQQVPKMETEEITPDSKASAAEQYILQNFYRATSKDPEMTEEKKLDVLADLLQQQFHQELLENGNLVETEIKTTVKLVSTTTTTTPPTTSIPPEKKIKIRVKQNSTLAAKIKIQEGSKSKQKEISIMSPVVDVLADTDPADLVPESLMSWLLGGPRHMSDEEPEIQLHMNYKRKRRSAPAPTTAPQEVSDAEVEKVTASFIQDIRNMFSIVSFLDINRCLEKMVCEIHNGGRSEVTEYEKNIIAAFKIMDKIMPIETTTVDSTTKYRQAAYLGQRILSHTNICAKLFASCGFSTQDIIKLGSITVPSSTMFTSNVKISPSTTEESVPLFRNAEEIDENTGA